MSHRHSPAPDPTADPCPIEAAGPIVPVPGAGPKGCGGNPCGGIGTPRVPIIQEEQTAVGTFQNIPSASRKQHHSDSGERVYHRLLLSGCPGCLGSIFHLFLLLLEFFQLRFQIFSLQLLLSVHSCLDYILQLVRTLGNALNHLWDAVLRGTSGSHFCHLPLQVALFNVVGIISDVFCIILEFGQTLHQLLLECFLIRCSRADAWYQILNRIGIAIESLAECLKRFNQSSVVLHW